MEAFQRRFRRKLALMTEQQLHPGSLGPVPYASCLWTSNSCCEQRPVLRDQSGSLAQWMLCGYSGHIDSASCLRPRLAATITIAAFVLVPQGQPTCLPPESSLEILVFCYFVIFYLLNSVTLILTWILLQLAISSMMRLWLAMPLLVTLG